MKTVSILIIIFTAAFAFAAASGEDTFYKKCGQCHGTTLSLNASKNESQWTDTIKRMEKHGLNISSSEIKSVAQFLAGRKK